MKTSTKILIGALIIAALAIGFLSNLVFKKSKTNPETSPVQNSQNQTPSQAPKYQYGFASNYKEGAPFVDNTYDGKIVQLNLTTGEETILVPSVKAAYPKLKEAPNKTFQVLNSSTTNPYLYLTVIYSESDGGMNGIIRFDGTTKKFTNLKIEQYFGPFTSEYSANSPYAASIQSPSEDPQTAKYQSLYLLDFDKDSVKKLATLPPGQTFNSCYNAGCLGDAANDITWLSPTQFEIGVYDMTKQEIDSDNLATPKLIEKRKFNITQ